MVRIAIQSGSKWYGCVSIRPLVLLSSRVSSPAGGECVVRRLLPATVLAVGMFLLCFGPKAQKGCYHVYVSGQ